MTQVGLAGIVGEKGISVDILHELKKAHFLAKDQILDLLAYHERSYVTQILDGMVREGKVILGVDIKRGLYHLPHYGLPSASELETDFIRLNMVGFSEPTI